MAAFQTPEKELLQHEIGSDRVTSEAERVFLYEVFVWSVDPVHLPLTQKESGNPIREARKKKKRQELRSWQALLARVEGLRQAHPQNKRRAIISEDISNLIKKLRDQMQWVAYTAKDGYSWYMRKGVMPAIGPRLLLALCIAQELWPERSPYQAVLAQTGRAQDPNLDSIDNCTHAIRKRALAVLKHPEKYPVFGGARTTDPCILLWHELFDFKLWKETRQKRPNQSVEEFEAQFDEYRNRIYPSAAEEQLLRRLLHTFLEGIQKRSRKAKGNKRVFC